MLTADAMLMADRAAVRDDRRARRGLEGLPAAVGVVGVRAQPKEKCRVDAGPVRIDMREVREGMHALAHAGECGAQRALDCGNHRRDIAPVCRRLDRVDGETVLPQLVAQIRRAEAPALPLAAKRPPDMHTAM